MHGMRVSWYSASRASTRYRLTRCDAPDVCDAPAHKPMCATACYAHAMPYHAMRACFVPYHAMRACSVPYHAMCACIHETMPRHAMPCTISWHTSKGRRIHSDYTRPQNVPSLQPAEGQGGSPPAAPPDSNGTRGNFIELDQG